MHQAATPPQTVRTGIGIALAAMLGAGFALTLWVFYPGYMTNDAIFVYQFAREGQYGDWQSPVMSVLWRWIDPVAPGPGSMFLLMAAFYWAGFSLLALAVARLAPRLALVVPLVALVPPAFMMLGMIWRDVLFGALWLVAATVAFAVAERETRIRWPAQMFALVLVAFGVLLRPNAVFAAAVLAAYVIWPTRFEWKRTALLFVPAVAMGLAIVPLTFYGMLDAKRENPLHSLFVFDLGGITYFAGENRFPVSWNAEETALLTTKCYDARNWDAYWTLDPCQFVMQRLERKDDRVFGTPRLMQAWRDAILAHPLAYLQHRATFAWTFLARDSIAVDVPRTNDPARTPLATHPPFQALVALYLVIMDTPLFRQGFWLIAALMVGALAWRVRESPPGAFALGVTASTVVYTATFFVFGVASDFRYGYWLVLASLAGAVALIAARRRSDSATAT